MLTLKNLKVAKNLTRETLAYTADVYWEGRRLGMIENDGHGGMSHLRAYDAKREDLQAATTFAQSQQYDLGPEYGGPKNYSHLEDFIDDVAGKEGDRQDAKRWLSRALKAKVVFIAGKSVYTLKAIWTGREEAIRSALAKNHGDVVILNALPFEEAVDRYLAST